MNLLTFLFRKNADEQQQPRKKHGCLWTIIICGVLYLVLCFAIGAVIGGKMGGGSASLDKETVYKLKMEGVLQEQSEEPNPFAALMKGMPGMKASESVVGLSDLLSNIKLAKENDKVKGIYLNGGALSMAPANAKALRDALLDFKTSGKWIIAYADAYGQTNYYVASVADRIFLNPVGVVDWKGLGGQRMYYKRILDNLGIEMQIIKVGTFKSAVEPYFRTSMSEADRKQTELYLSGIWDEFKQAVASSRNLTIKQLDAYADEYMALQDAEKYVQYGLIDSLVYPQQMDTILKTYMGSADFQTLGTSGMASVKRATNKSQNEIAIVYAEGGITDDSGDGIVGTKMVKTLNKVAKEKNVKAVVFRVNSPGGSANASEQIWHAVTMLQEKGLPVVVSMGDYAASGGYYISCSADYIYAEPTTLTGSIGIFGTVPNFNKLRNKVGLDIDGVTTNKHSALESNMVYKGMNAEEFALMQNMVNRGYDLFTRRCADGRHMSQDAIKRIAEGRVWLGKDAIAIGLVDELGNIDNAIAKAAALAGLTDWKVVSYPAKKDPFTELIESLNEPDTEEERIVAKIKEFASQPRIMTLMPEITIR